MFLTISLAIVDTRSSSFDAPQQGEVAGQTAHCLLRRLGCVVERSGTDISHTLSFYFPNVIGLVQRIVLFICVLNRKPRTERFNTNTRIVTPLIYIYIHTHTYIHTYIYMCVCVNTLHCKCRPWAKNSSLEQKNALPKLWQQRWKHSSCI